MTYPFTRCLLTIMAGIALLAAPLGWQAVIGFLAMPLPVLAVVVWFERYERRQMAQQ